MSSLATTQQIQFEKPSLNHTILYRFSELPTQNTTLKHFKNYLDTFKEPLQERHTFGKKYFFSKSVDLQRKNSTPSKRYAKYEKMVSYSVKKYHASKVEEIRSRNQQRPKRNLRRISNLNEIMTNNMTAELISQNNFVPKDEAVQETLKDNTSRSQLFDQVILVDRLLQIRKDSQAVKETRRTKCIEDHSKHFHLNEIHRDINTFYRRKYVKQNLTFHFQHTIAKFQTTKLRKRSEQNRTLMKNIMGHYSKQMHLQKDIHSSNINETIKRLFLHYSREGSVQDSFISINNKQLRQFLKDFELQIEGNNEVVMEMAASNTVSYHDFVELIYSLGRPQYYNTVQQFLKEKVIKKSCIYVPSECSLYEQRKQEIDNALKANKVQQRLQKICKKMKKLGVQLNGDRWLNFDDFHELMLLLKIYPTFVSKKKMKFYFLYCESSCNMIRLQDVQRVIGYISMEGEQSGRNKLIQLIHLIRQYRV